MATNLSASLEARLKNNKDLIEALKKLSKYNPTAEDIRAEKFGEFIDTVEAQIVPYKNSAAELTTAQTNNIRIIKKMIVITKEVRSEIAEVKTEDSDEYRHVNSIVKLITGQNIIEHSADRKAVESALKEGEILHGTVSVAQLDFKSRLGNFKSLIALLRTYSFYMPTDAALQLAALETLEAEVSRSITKIAEKESGFVVSRSAVMEMFDNKGGLRDRAKRARLHVRRKYGIKSPEYRSTVNKRY